MKFVPFLDVMTADSIYVNPEKISAFRKSKNDQCTDLFFVGEERTWLTVEEDVQTVRKMLQGN